MERPGPALVEARWGRTLGLGLLLLGLLPYESFASRPILGRWSPAAFAAICAVAAAFATSLIASQRAARGGFAPPAARPSAAALDLGVALLGASYLLAALDDPAAGGRLLELDLFGSRHAPALVLGWLALGALGAGLAARAAARWGAAAPGALLAVGSLAAFAWLGEGVARGVCVAAPRTQGYPTTCQQLWMRRHAALNRAGYRDRERARAKPAGAHRIALIGDSFTFGLGVARVEDRAGERLEALLGAGPGPPVEVLNFGIPNTHTLEHRETLEDALGYAPDLVLLLYVFNDIGYLERPPREVAVAQPDSLLGRLHPVRLLFLNSLFYQQVHLRLRQLVWGLGLAGTVRSAYDAPERVAQHLGDLAAFVERARAAGTPAAIVPFHPEFARPARSESERGFVARLVGTGLPVWPLEGLWQGTDPAELFVSPVDGHPSEVANARLARALAERVTALWRGGAAPH